MWTAISNILFQDSSYKFSYLSVFLTNKLIHIIELHTAISNLYNICPLVGYPASLILLLSHPYRIIILVTKIVTSVCGEYESLLYFFILIYNLHNLK